MKNSSLLVLFVVILLTGCFDSEIPPPQAENVSHAYEEWFMAGIEEHQDLATVLVSLRKFNVQQASRLEELSADSATRLSNARKEANNRAANGVKKGAELDADTLEIHSVSVDYLQKKTDKAWYIEARIETEYLGLKSVEPVSMILSYLNRRWVIEQMMGAGSDFKALLNNKIQRSLNKVQPLRQQLDSALKHRKKHYAGALTDESVPSTREAAHKPVILDDACKMPIRKGVNIDDLKIYMGGEYRGSESEYQIDDSGHQATEFDVRVNLPEHPVALVLGAYEPSIWTIRKSRDTNIVAVVVTGYHKQMIQGLDKNIPVLNTSYDNGAECGYLYVAKSKLNQLSAFSRKIFGKNADFVSFAKKGRLILGPKLYSSQYVPPLKDVKQKTTQKKRILAGDAGLTQAVRKGTLRYATEKDLRKWAKARMQEARKNDDLPRHIQGDVLSAFKPKYLRRGRAYVIIGDFTFPAGLTGAHSASFFLPKGVIYPKGNPGHSTIYDYNTLSCRGASPGCRL